MNNKSPECFISDQSKAIQGAIRDLIEEGVISTQHFLDVWHFVRSAHIKNRLLSQKLQRLLYLKTEQ